MTPLDLAAIQQRAEDPPFVAGYSVCSLCDADIGPDLVPAEPCGHGPGSARGVNVACVPAADALSLIAEVENLRAALREIISIVGYDLDAHQLPDSPSWVISTARAVGDRRGSSFR